MVMVNLQGIEYGLDGFLQRRLDNVKMILQKNWDCLIIIAGKERSGKSTLGLTISTYLYPQMNESNIAVNGEDAIKKFESLPNKSVLLIDEGSLMFSSKDSMVSEQKKLIKILNVIGQKNIVMILCIPSYFDLNQYIACERARFLLVTYTDSQLERGRGMYFGTDKLMQLYKYGKKNFHSYSYPESDFVFRFGNYEPSWFKQYLEIKGKTLMATLHAPTPTEKEAEKRRLLEEKRELKEVKWKTAFEKLAGVILRKKLLKKVEIEGITGIEKHFRVDFGDENDLNA